jgi:hypothetical protein
MGSEPKAVVADVENDKLCFEHDIAHYLNRVLSA